MVSEHEETYIWVVLDTVESTKSWAQNTDVPCSKSVLVSWYRV